MRALLLLRSGPLQDLHGEGGNECDWEAINPKDGSIDPIIFTTSGQHIKDQDFFNARGSGPAGLTIGFWKTNVGKDLYYIYGNPQVSASTMERCLRAIYAKYYVGMGYNFAFLKFDSSMNQKAGFTEGLGDLEHTGQLKHAEEG